MLTEKGSRGQEEQRAGGNEKKIERERDEKLKHKKRTRVLWSSYKGKKVGLTIHTSAHFSSPVLITINPAYCHLVRHSQIDIYFLLMKSVIF
jgi:hypothetical protein